MIPEPSGSSLSHKPRKLSAQSAFVCRLCRIYQYFASVCLVTQNPRWTYEELVLAVDLIDRRGWVGGGARTPDVIELSQLLRAINYPQLEDPDSRFRSPNSISLKLGNLKGANPRVAGGLRVTGREKDVVAHFLGNRDIMRALASSLRLSAQPGMDAVRQVTSEVLDDEETTVALEGGPKYVLALRRERSRALRKRKLRQVEEALGSVACEVCGFDFANAYGDLGAGYAEVHHRTPLHVSGEIGSTTEGLAVLCANCHRMVHRRGWITVEQLAGMICAPRPGAVSRVGL